MDIKEINERIQRESAFVDLLLMELSKVIVGQKYMTERLFIGLLANGHVLLEGVPGLAKTLAIKSTVLLQKCKVHCSKPCRNVRLRLGIPHSNFLSLSLSLLHRILSNKKEPIHFLKRRWIVSC